MVVGLGFIWRAILAIGIGFMPESPRWLAARAGRCARCRCVRCGFGLHLRREAEEILTSVEYEQSVKGGWLDCFRVEIKTLYRTFLGTPAPVPHSPRRV